MNGRIAILTDDPGWHGTQLRRALAARGYDGIMLPLTACRFEVDAAGPGIFVPGFDERLPDGAFVRGVAAGSLEQVVLRLSLLHALERLGVPVYNPAPAIERSVDKAMTSFLLARAGLPTPPTWVCESEAEARTVVRREISAGHQVIFKPLFGSQGNGVIRIPSLAALPAAEETGGVYYLQRYVDTGDAGFHDWRVLVAGHRPLGAMKRCGSQWLNNLAQGARCEPADGDAELARLAVAAVDALGMEYAGVDLMRDRQGRTFVVEVNGIPAWKGLQQVCTDDLTQRLVDDFLQRHLAVMPVEAAS